jgi:hypothetical protein
MSGSGAPTWRAYDLPHPEPVAEWLTYEEMLRFEELGFYIERTPVSLSSEVAGELDRRRAIQVRRERYRVARKKARARESSSKVDGRRRVAGADQTKQGTGAQR